MVGVSLDVARKSVPIAFVYGCLLTCTSVVLWGGYIDLLDTTELSSQFSFVEYFVRSTCFALSFFVLAFVAFKKPRLSLWRTPLIPLCLFVLGAVLVFVLRLNLLPINVVLPVVGALFGWGSGHAFCSLQRVVASLRARDAGVVVFAAAGISALVYLLLDVLSRTIMLNVTLYILTPATMILLFFVDKAVPASHPMFDTNPAQHLDRCKQAALDLWPTLLCVAFSAFIVGIVREGTVLNSQSLLVVNEGNVRGLLLASVALLISWRFIYENINMTTLYRILFPLTATAFLLLPLLEGGFRNGVLSFVFVVFSITSSLMVVSCAREARSNLIQPVLVYGLFAGVVYMVTSVGSLCSFLFARLFAEQAIASLSVVALLALYIMSMGLNAYREQRFAKRPSLSSSAASANAVVQAPASSASAGACAGVSNVFDGSSVPAKQSAAPNAGRLFEPQPEPVVASTQPPSLEARCALVTERWELSAREAEVMLLLARGRDVPHIAAELVISKNTVKTHSKNIFSKAGVHSRQELLDLVEAAE